MPPNAPPSLVRRVFALLREAKISDRQERINLMRWLCADPSIESTNDLSEIDLRMVADTLAHWKRNGELEFQARQHCGLLKEGDL